MGCQRILTAVVGRASLLAVAAVMASSASAQDAQPAASADPLGEIVVTAQFRAQNLQETPLSITAVSADQLAARSFTNVTEVGSTAPSVTLRMGSSGYGKSTQAYIRGIGQSDFNFALEPAVGFYVDDVYHAGLFGSTFDLLDLDRIEILRGPQGTLFGKNSIGGAVRLISKKPSNDFEASVEGTYGSYERLDFRGMINLPLIDNVLALRVSGVSKHRDGYVDRVDFACAHPDQAGSIPPTVTATSGSCKVGTLGGESVSAGRAALRWTPSSAVEVNLTAEIVRDNSEGAADSLIYVDTSAPALANFNNNVLIPNYGIPFDNRFVTDPYVTYANYTNLLRGRSVPAVNTMHSESFSGDATWHLTDDIQLKSITAYQKYSGRFTQNANNSPLPIALTDNQAAFKQFTQELRLVGTSFNGMLDWATGLFYFSGQSKLGGSVILQAAGPSGIAFDQDDSTNARNKSAFAHGSFHLTDRFTVTAGLRYTNEWKTYTFDRTNQPAGTPFFPGGAFTSPKSKTSRVDYKLGADYKLTDDIMVYAQFSTGFKGGGINPRPFTPAAAVPFGPETLNAYEIGIKTELFDRRVRFNLAAYHSDYSNLQLSANGYDNNGVQSIVLANAGSADIEGVEAELQIRPSRALQIDASASYTGFELKDLGAAAGVSGGPTLASKAPGTPEWKFNAGAQYAFDLGDVGSLTPRLDVYYQSRVYNEWTNNPLAAQSGYAIANGRLTYTAPDDSWSAALAVTNIFDKFYYVNKFIQSGSYIFTGQPSRPREWSVTLRKQF
ncbi:MAG TPA: TonB-dependent receptor [Sphingomonadaceae bacterium]|nr:TonB-dependent receptor [Sphingomonadaceae bacterium]